MIPNLVYFRTNKLNMIKSLFTQIFIFLIIFLGKIVVVAQGCHEYFPYKIGTEWEITMYDDKEKIISVNTYKILDQDGINYQVSIRSVDIKGKEKLNMTTKWKCENNQLSFEMKDFFPPTAAMNNTKAELKLTGDNLNYPKKLIPGQSLPDANSTLEMYIDGMRFMNMQMKVYERKVENNETVTTPAGTFECIKLTQMTDVKSMFNVKAKSTLWLAKEHGMVKTQSYNEKGRLMSTQLMTKFKS